VGNPAQRAKARRGDLFERALRVPIKGAMMRRLF
jgi:hypothetical protein